MIGTVKNPIALYRVEDKFLIDGENSISILDYENVVDGFNIDVMYKGTSVGTIGGDSCPDF